MAKSMLHEKKLPYFFWGVAANAAFYILNGYSTKIVANKIPF